MKPDALTLFLATMPAAMKLFLGVFLGATVHFLRNLAVPLRDGIAAALIAIIGGYLLTLGLCKWQKWDAGEFWYVGGGVSFMANYFIGGMETVGKQIQETPIKLLIDTILDTYEGVMARLKKPNP